MMLTRTAEPYVGRPWPVTPFSLILAIDFENASFSIAASFTLTLPVPLTTMALRFLEPITAPTPDLPAARPLSFIMPDIFERFSPAGPIVATRTFSP
ncbi:hypothetical protein SDC9_60322 [bioreactor metagenome]|uniref:Uncharacterized protein n=1 Tax=bioreactor metagenome TaxID=1076179 RepID=A0A644XCQ8_9ZZZZ